jgi:hypothetical protein
MKKAAGSCDLSVLCAADVWRLRDASGYPRVSIARVYRVKAMRDCYDSFRCKVFITRLSTDRARLVVQRAERSVLYATFEHLYFVTRG